MDSAGMLLTSSDRSEIRIKALYHAQKAHEIFSDIAARRKNTKVMVLSNQMASIIEQIQYLTKDEP